MLVLVKQKNNATDAVVLVDYFSYRCNFGPINIGNHLPWTQAQASSSQAEAKMITFGSRFSKEAVELGMYQSVSVNKNSEQISGMLPSFRYIGVAPDALTKLNEAEDELMAWGNPLWSCGFDNLFVYNDAGFVVRQYSVMTSPPPDGVCYQPWVYSAYDRTTSAWEHLFHIKAPNETVWIHHLENPINTPARALKQCSSGKRAVWGEFAGKSTFTCGQYVNERLEGYGASLAVFNDETAYYLGEFKNNLRDGKGSNLVISHATAGEAAFFHGTWVQDKLHGEFVIEYTSKVPEMNFTERGTYQMNARAGLWCRQFKDGKVDWFQADCHLAIENEAHLPKYIVLGDNRVRKFMPADRFLSLLILNQYHELIAKMLEKNTYQSLLDICALAVKNEEFLVPIVCFSNSIASITSDFFNHALLIDNARLLTIFELAEYMLASAPNSPLYIAVKGAIDLFSTKLEQKVIVAHLMKVFPAVSYTEMHNKKSVERAVKNYQDNVKKHYLIGMLERIQIIVSFLTKVSRPKIESLHQLLDELKREDARLSEQQALEAKNAEVERAMRQEKARWSKVSLELDENVLAFMRELRADEKDARTRLFEDYQRKSKALLVSSRANKQAPVKKNMPLPPVPVEEKAVLSITRTPMQPVPLSVKPEQQSQSASTPAVPGSAVTSPLFFEHAAVSNKNAPPIAQQTDKQYSPATSVIVNDVPLPTSLPARSQSVLHRDGIASQSAASVHSSIKRPLVDQSVSKLPSFVHRLLKNYSGGIVNDCSLIYKGMMIKALKASQQPITWGEAACLRAAQVKETQYFKGLRNAFLSPPFLHSSLLKAATLHARALIYLTEGGKINLEHVVSFFQDASTAQDVINKMMAIKCSSAPEQYLITDESALHKIVFGFVIELSDDMGLGALIDRLLFNGDYRDYLAKIRAIIALEAPAECKSLISSLGKTALACFERIILMSGSVNMYLRPIRSEGPH